MEWNCWAGYKSNQYTKKSGKNMLPQYNILWHFDGDSYKLVA